MQMSIFAIVIIVGQKGERADGMDSLMLLPLQPQNQLRWVATTTGVSSNDISLSCAQSVYSISFPSLDS